MREDLDVIHPLVEMMLAIVRRADPAVHERLLLLSVPPFFCVSWMLTYFAHDIRSLYDAQRIFDFFLENHPTAVVYASAAVPMLFRTELLRTETGQAESHQWLKELPQKLQPSLLILHTARLMERHPPDSLSFTGKDVIRGTVFSSRIAAPSLSRRGILATIAVLLLAILVHTLYK